MIELGELERHHAEFDSRHVQVVVVSLDDADESKKTKKDYPHLVVVSDPERKLVSAVEVLHPGAGQRGTDTAAPTTFLIDRQGTVRSVFRPRQVIRRLSAQEVLAAVDADLPRVE